MKAQALRVGGLVVLSAFFLIAQGLDGAFATGLSKSRLSLGGPGDGVAFCCSSRAIVDVVSTQQANGTAAFQGENCVRIGNTPRDVNACLEGDIKDSSGSPISGPDRISAGCLSGIWVCEPKDGKPNCCCAPSQGETCIP